MAEHESLAKLINAHLDLLGITIAEAARRANMSWRQMHRLCNGVSVYVQPATITALVDLGLDRRAIVLAAYGSERVAATT